MWLCGVGLRYMWSRQLGVCVSFDVVVANDSPFHVCVLNLLCFLQCACLPNPCSVKCFMHIINDDSFIHTDVWRRFGIDCSTWSKQLPTVILFQEGKEHIRRPVSSKKTTLKFLFTKVEQDCVVSLSKEKVGGIFLVLSTGIPWLMPPSWLVSL